MLNMKKTNIRALINLVITLAIAIVIIWAALYYRSDLEPDRIRNMVNGFGILAPLIFVLLYIITTLFFIPGMPLTIAGGYIFGLGFGTFYNMIGATLGCMGAFLIARYFGRDWIEHHTSQHIKLLMEGTEKEDWKYVFLLRLMPLTPFAVFNYLLGLTRIRLANYVGASALGMFPGVIAYTYLGHLGAEVAKGSERLVEEILIGIGLIVLVAFLPGIIKRFRSKLK